MIIAQTPTHNSMFVNTWMSADASAFAQNPPQFFDITDSREVDLHSIFGAEKVDSALSIIEALNNSPFHFHLTGSLYFLKSLIHRSLSKAYDVDFFTNHTQAAVNFLHRLGFVERSVHRYKDANMVLVMSRGNFDVQLVKSAEVKLIAQNLIYVTLAHQSQTHNFTKGMAQVTWDAVITAVALMEPAKVATAYHRYMYHHRQWVKTRPIGSDFADKLKQAIRSK